MNVESLLAPAVAEVWGKNVVEANIYKYGEVVVK